MPRKPILFLSSLLFHSLAAQEVDTYPNIRPVGNSEGVFFNGNSFQMLGSDLGLVSSDGIRWESGSNLPSNSRYIVKGGGLTVTTSTNTIYYSTDEVTWTSATGATGSFRGIAYGNGIFAISLSDGNFLTSTDGANWVQRTGPNLQGTVTIRDFKFIHGSFYVTGFNSFLCRSTDGIAWTEADSPITDSNSFALTAMGNRVGVFGLEEGYLFDPVSPDDGHYAVSQDFGQTMTLSTLATPEDFESVSFANGAFLLVDEEGKAFRSVDGVTWTQVMSDAPGPSSPIFPIIHDGEHFITKGDSGVALSEEG